MTVFHVIQIWRKSDEYTLIYNKDEKKRKLSELAQELIQGLKEGGKLRTAETYQAALSSLQQFMASQSIAEDILLQELTAELVEHFEKWLFQKGVVANTVSFYMRILRAMYNRGVERGYAEDQRPFRRVYTGVAKTPKRALSQNIIAAIKKMDLSAQPGLEYARDMFLLSFMLRGMSFVDMSYLLKSDVSGGYVKYRRRKTGQLLEVKWTEGMQHIVDKYDSGTSKYLLPLIDGSATDERVAYLNASAKINRRLKKIGKMLNLSVSLTMYIARHSWASIARDIGVPISVISQGMGHDSEATTRIYLSAINTSIIDEANDLVMSVI